VLSAGCDKVTGGGWITSSADPLEKATFGFTAKCRNTTVNSTPTAVLYDGELEYHDSAADVRIHGDVEPEEVLGMTCGQIHEMGIFPIATFVGTYRSQRGGEAGDFEVTVTDNGEPGRNGDMFEIELTGDITHTNFGPVQGGNIQVH
jgi:hypothetical protein